MLAQVATQMLSKEAKNAHTISYYTAPTYKATWLLFSHLGFCFCKYSLIHLWIYSSLCFPAKPNSFFMLSKAVCIADAWSQRDSGVLQRKCCKSLVSTHLKMAVYVFQTFLTQSIATLLHLKMHLWILTLLEWNLSPHNKCGFLDLYNFGALTTACISHHSLCTHLVWAHIVVLLQCSWMVPIPCNSGSANQNIT